MRIGIVVPTFSESIPSNELWLAVGLSRRGHDVTILTSHRASARDRFLAGAGVILPKEPPFGVVRLGTLPALFPELSVPLGLREALSETFDALLLQEDYPSFCLAAGAVARRERIPYLASFERYGYFTGALPAAVSRIQDMTVNRTLRNHATALTFHSRASAAFLRSIGASTEHMYYTPTPTDCGHFRPGPAPPDARPDSASRIVCIARLVPAKGLAVLLRAVQRLTRADVPPFQVHIRGRGPLAGSLRQQIRDLKLDRWVELSEEPLSLPMLPDFYRAADIYVQPSRYEPYGLAGREAMASGLPLVATRVGGLTDAVEDGVTGLLAPPDDAERLAGALSSLLRDPDLRRRMGHEGRRKAETEFDLDVVADRHQRILLGQTTDADTIRFGDAH